MSLEINNLTLMYLVIAIVALALGLFFHATYRYDRDKKLDQGQRKR